jgi:hypothetical protein
LIKKNPPTTDTSDKIKKTEEIFNKSFSKTLSSARKINKQTQHPVGMESHIDITYNLTRFSIRADKTIIATLKKYRRGGDLSPQEQATLKTIQDTCQKLITPQQTTPQISPPSNISIKRLAPKQYSSKKTHLVFTHRLAKFAIKADKHIIETLKKFRHGKKLSLEETDIVHDIQARCADVIQSLAKPQTVSAKQPMQPIENVSITHIPLKEYGTVKLTGFFVSIHNFFVRLWEFLSGKTAKNQLKTRFAMQLFDEMPQGKDASLSLADTMKLWNMSFASIGNVNMAKKLPAFQKLATFQTSCETIASIENPYTRDKERAKLENKIQEYVKSSKTGSPIYIPGGIWRNKASYHLIYELTWNKDLNKWKIRVFDTSGQLFRDEDQTVAPSETLLQNSLKSKTISRAELQKFMGALQPAQEEQKTQSFNPQETDLDDKALQESIKESTYALTMGKQKTSTQKGFLGILIVSVQRKLETAKFGKDPYTIFRKQWTALDPATFRKVVPGVTISNSDNLTARQDSPNEQMDIFLQTLAKDEYRELMFSARAHNFLWIWEHAATSLHDATLRGWIRKTGEHLLEEIEKQQSVLPPEKQTDIQYLKNQIALIVTNLQEFEKVATFPLPKSSSSKEVETTRFSTPFRSSVDIVSIKDLHRRATEGTQPLKKIDYTEILKTPRSLNRFITELEKLSDNKSFQELVSRLTYVFQALESVSLDTIKTLASNLPNAIEMIYCIQQLGFLVAKASFGQGRMSPFPQDVHQYLLALKIQDQLVRNCPDLTKDPYVSTRCLDMKPLERIIAHPFFNPGEFAAGISTSLQYFKKLQGTPAFCGQGIQGNSTTKGQNYEDLELFQKYPEAKNVQENLGMNLQKFPENGIPEHVQYLRESYIMFDVLLSPTRVLMPYTYMDIAKCSGRLLKTQDIDTVDTLLRLGLKNFATLNAEFVSQEMPKRVGEGKIQFSILKDHFLIRSDLIVIEPWGFSVKKSDQDIGFPGMQSKFDIEHPETFSTQGAYVSEDLQKIYSQVVLLGDEYEASEIGIIPRTSSNPVVSYTSAGAPIEDKAAFEKPCTAKSEWDILLEEHPIPGLPIDVSKELQLIQTGKNTIAQNCVTFLRNHIATLDDEEIGPQVAQLLEQNLLKYALNNPQEKQVLTSALSEILHAFTDATSLKQTQAAARLFNIARLLYMFLQKIHGAPEAAIASSFSTAKETFLKLDYQHTKNPRELCIAKLFLYEQELRNIPQNEINKRKEGVDNALTVLHELIEYPCEKPESPILQEKIHKIRQELLQDLDLKLQDKAQKDALCNKLAKTEHKTPPWEWKNVSPFVFQHGSTTIDFARGEIWHHGSRWQPLPNNLIAHPQFSKIEKFLRQSGLSQDIEISKIQWKAYQTVSPKSQRSITFQYRIPKTKIDFRLVVQEDSTVLIYRRKSFLDGWYQYLPNVTSPPQDRPSDTPPLPPGDYWINPEDDIMVIEKDGIPEWTAITDSQDHSKIDSLHKNRSTSEVVANVFGNRYFQHFFDLEDQKNVAAISKDGTVRKVEYLNRTPPYSYEWDTASNHWIPNRFPQYFLSEKSLEHYAFSPTHSDLSENQARAKRLESFQHFFNPAFSLYHLLEPTQSGNALIIMPGVPMKEISQLQGKHLSHTFKPQWPEEPNAKAPQYTFELDPIKGCIAREQPDGYLYLAYSLLVQGNLKDCFYYLNKADLRLPLSKQGAEFLELIQQVLEKLPKNTPELPELKARLLLISSRAHEEGRAPILDIRSAQTAIQAQALLENIGKGNLQLSPQEVNELKYTISFTWFTFLNAVSKTEKAWELKNRALQKLTTATSATNPDQALLQLQQDSDWKTFETEYMKPFAITIKDLKDVQNSLDLDKKELAQLSAYERLENLQKSTYKKECSVLEKEIGDLEEAVAFSPEEQKTSAPSATKTTPLFGTTFDGFFVSTESPKPLGQETRVSTHLLSKAQDFGEENRYAQELIDDLTADCKAYESTSGILQKKSLNFDKKEELSQKIDSALSDNQQVFSKNKDKILKAVNSYILQQNPSTLQGLIHDIRGVGRTSDEAIVDTVIRCAGEGNWNLLEKICGLDEEKHLSIDIDKEEISKFVKNFLKAAIQIQQLKKAKNLILQLPNTAATPEHHRLAMELKDILQSSWYYDPDKDPHGLSYLLIEYELGFVCRQSQIKVVQAYLQTANVFKQEICGGGKTTVLRNIISQLRANGKILAGVSTLQPLRAEHGLLYARTTKNAFGGMVFSFKFDCSTPTDELSLLHLHHDLLATTVHRGRVDLSRGDLQTLKLVTLLKYDEATNVRKKLEKLPQDIDPKIRLKLEEKINRLHKEIDIIENIRDFLEEHASIVADELDKDCDPTQEKNLAYGQNTPLHEEQREAALSIISKIFTSNNEHVKKLAKAFQENAQTDLAAKEVDDALEGISKELFSSFKDEIKNVSETEFIAYLTGKKGAEKTATTIFAPFQEIPQKPLSSKLQQLAFTREFISDCIKEACKKRNGVSYGRSIDGVSTIPFGGSNQRKEGSEYSSDMERIWYTVVDYIHSGITLKQTRSLWMQAKDRAIREVSSARKEVPSRRLEIDQTPSAIRFAQNILSKVNTNLTLSSVQESDLPNICTAVNKSPENLIHFLREEVLPGLQQSSEKIVSDSQDPAYMVREISGSSGTDLLAKALPDKINVKDCRQTGVHGEILLNLQMIEEQFKNPAMDQYIVYGGESKKQQRDSLINVLAEQMHGGDCLSEVGCLFPGESGLHIAQSIRSKISKKPCPYFLFMDESDKWQMLSSNGEVVPYNPHIDQKNIITIFDDVHTRGAERPSPAGVTEFVTLDIDTDFSRFEQAVMRERGVTKGKAKTRFILSPKLGHLLQAESAKQAKDKKIIQILSEILVRNEADKLKMLNYKAERQKILHILKRFGERALRQLSSSFKNASSKMHHTAREVIFSQLRELYFFEQQADALASAYPKGSIQASVALDNLVQQQLTLLDSIEAKLSTNKLRAIRAPVPTLKMKAQLGKISTNITNTIQKLTDLEDSIENILETAPQVDVLQQQRDKLQLTLNALKEQKESLSKQKEKIDKLSSQLDQSLKGAKESGIDFHKNIMEIVQEGSKSVEQAQTTIKSHIEELDGAYKQAIKDTQKYIDINDIPGVQEVRSLKKSAEMLLPAISVLKMSIDAYGAPVLPIVTGVLELARPLLKAKFSDTYKKEHTIPQMSPESQQVVESKLAKYHEKIVPRIDAKYLPSVVPTGKDLGNENEVEVQVEQEVTKEAATEPGDKNHYPYCFIAMPKIGRNDSPTVKLQSAHSFHSLSTTHASQENKFYTENFYPKAQSEGRLQPWYFQNDKLIVPPQRPIQRTFFVINGTNIAEIFGSQQDNEHVFHPYVRSVHLPSSQSYLQAAMYNYDLGKFDYPPGFMPKDEHQARIIMKSVVTTKLLNQDVDFAGDITKTSNDVKDILENPKAALYSYLKSLSKKEFDTIRKQMRELHKNLRDADYEKTDLGQVFQKVVNETR